MKNDKATTTLKPIATRAQAESAMEVLAAIDARLAEVIAQERGEMQGVIARFSEEKARLEMQGADIEEALTQWAIAHPDEFGGSKTIRLNSGEIVKRITGWSVRFLKDARNTLSKLLALPKKQRESYVRTTDEINRQAILSDREKLNDAFWKRLGIGFEQEERITVKPIRNAK